MLVEFVRRQLNAAMREAREDTVTDAEIEIVGRLADMLRAKGVKSIDVGGCRMELEPIQAKAEPSKPQVDHDLCDCKCPEYAHVNGLCVNGCEPSKCASIKAEL